MAAMVDVRVRENVSGGCGRHSGWGIGPVSGKWWDQVFRWEQGCSSSERLGRVCTFVLALLLLFLFGRRVTDELLSELESPSAPMPSARDTESPMSSPS